MFLLCKSAIKDKNYGYVVSAVLIYAFVFGCRYGVGTDFFSYDFIYNRALNGYADIPNWEFGFVFIINTLVKFGLHSAFFFCVIAYLQLMLIFSSVKRDRYIYTYLVFTFMIGCTWLSFSNGLRQILAFCFFAFALTCVDRKEWKKHYLLLLLAISVHTSAYFLLIFYPILHYKEEWFTNPKIQFAILILAYLVGETGLIAQYVYLFDELLSIDALADSYGVYSGYEEKLYSEVSKGLGYYIILSTDIILVLNSNKIKKIAGSVFPIVIYNFYFIGTILMHAFIDSHMIQRFNYYFYGFQFIFASYALYSFYQAKSFKQFYILISMYLLTFIANMSNMEGNTALFRFFWENDYL